MFLIDIFLMSAYYLIFFMVAYSSTLFIVNAVHVFMDKITIESFTNGQASR